MRAALVVACHGLSDRVADRLDVGKRAVECVLAPELLVDRLGQRVVVRRAVLRHQHRHARGLEFGHVRPRTVRQPAVGVVYERALAAASPRERVAQGP